MKAVIIAGGKGTRISQFIKDTPKSLIKIGKKPIIEHQLKLLKSYGIKEIWLLLGYLGDQIKEYLKDGKKFGVNLHYYEEKEPLGTAGAVKTLEKEIKEDFLALSGDVMMNFDIKRFIKWHKQKKGIASIVVHPNDHPFDSDLVEVDDDGKIINLLKRPHPGDLIFRNLSIASLYIFSPDVFKYIPKNLKCDIEKDILPLLLKAKEKVFAYNTPEYFKDMGTPERLLKVNEDFLSGKVERLNFKNKRAAVFLDRDGVINVETDQLRRAKDLEIYDFSAEAIKKINDLGFLAIITTNQPMIAKGFMTEKDLDEIHKSIETELGLKGAKIDAFYHCPHHPEKGFPGEVPELKIDCNCRKPGIGMLLKAKEDFNIDFKKSYFIGDRSVDILAGKKAGCKTILVKTGYGGKDKLFPINPDFTVKNLLEAVKIIDKNKAYES